MIKQASNGGGAAPKRASKAKSSSTYSYGNLRTFAIGFFVGGCSILTIQSIVSSMSIATQSSSQIEWERLQAEMMLHPRTTTTLRDETNVSGCNQEQNEGGQEDIDLTLQLAPGVFAHGMGKYSTKISFPVLVASLPKSGSHSITNYFRCGGVWSKHGYAATVDGEKTPIGLCMLNNLQDSHNNNQEDLLPPKLPLEGCGGANVWADAGFVGYRDCFYPTVSPGVLHTFAKAYPNATIILVTRNVTQWLQQIQEQPDHDASAAAAAVMPLLERWKTNRLCRIMGFPSQDDFKDNHNETIIAAYQAFYHWHTERVRQFVKDHPTINYLEISLESNETAPQLEQSVGIPASCWNIARLDQAHKRAAAKGEKQKKRMIKKAKKARKAMKAMKKKNTKIDASLTIAPDVYKYGMGGTENTIKVPFPIFLASLPKSGTTSISDYFNCGKVWSKHHFSKFHNGTTGKIGECLRSNFEHREEGRRPFEGCGGANVWTDTGMIDPSYCFYPTITPGVLDYIFQSYPNATLLMVHRDTNGWLKSTKSHYPSLYERWPENEYCTEIGFPSGNVTDDDFIRFYNWHTEHIRTFAREHPSITYIEVPLHSHRTGAILEERIGVPAACWGQSNTETIQKSRRETKEREDSMLEMLEQLADLEKKE